jgi:hypothetical protein
MLTGRVRRGAWRERDLRRWFQEIFAGSNEIGLGFLNNRQIKRERKKRKKRKETIRRENQEDVYAMKE